MTTVNKQQIIGKVISLVNNEDPNYTTKLLYVMSCETKESNRFYLSGIMMEISKENPSMINDCYSNYVQVISREELEKLNQNSQHLNQYINGIDNRSITDIIAEADNASKGRFLAILRRKFSGQCMEIKTISGEELLVFISDVCWIKVKDGICIIVIDGRSHLLDKETAKYKIKDFVTSVNLLEFVK